MAIDYFIRLENVARTYFQGDTTIEALKHATCDICPKDRISIIGPSGSGKSTLLHIMAGLDDPTAGSIDWPLLGSKEVLRPAQIGFISQTRSLMSSLNVIENIALPLVLMGKRYQEAIDTASDLLKRMMLSDISQKLPNELSGGQLQRVAAARVLSTKPMVILADEPTGQLDHCTSEHLLDILFEYIDDTDTAVVISTHDLEIAGRMDKRWQINYGALEVNAT
ncbi:ABC transporter ATP-binding protein [Clostridium sp. WILCCON 0269]|uniref:ABC transporter ATP-binding protein n=1 Tax=Candidatus Clostridium eludens TaxID=3381663 RepID=A0ABW8SR19_9CLOT